MNTGLVQLVLFRQLITPEPYSPPTMNAAFFTDGMTSTHSARVHRSSGMPLSGDSRSSVKIAPPSRSRFTSSFDNSAYAEAAVRQIMLNVRTHFITQLSH